MKLTINTKSISRMQDEIFNVNTNKILRVHEWSPVFITGTLERENGGTERISLKVDISTFNFWEEDWFVINGTRFYCTKETRFSVYGTVYTDDFCTLTAD